ncbi:Rho guanine nucleotide exchange factor 7 [Frankliniella fusca]|uniref:Rho guanine nucleotide exchange factor 7 n=1 Tax=Frankliniella fusca TaxID=407009 RepID=A0AAE1LBS5_9NEOP|nr:Rho guanine nucleotide exchange factor 7 [Frankliniella fusca]
MATDSHPLLVQAVYSFQGKNNDELCFKKGDIITVTQKEEGGWWEGTLATTDKTGWFPSNYVKEYKPQEAMAIAGKTSPSVQMPVDLNAQQKAYRNLVLRDIIDSEKANVAELQTLVQNFLHPLESAEIIPRDDYRQLVSNMDEILAVQQHLLAALEDCATKQPNEQKVGRVFLTNAPRMKQVHLTYCAAHPRAVCVIDKYKDELNTWMESVGASVPGILVLTTGLSKPFRRLDKYASMLQELERHVEENHPDRGDTQRSVSVYKEIASACSTTRRQKELELEVLTGGVRGWEGDDLQILGDIIHMGSVAVGPDHRDRYLVLFPSTLLMLSVSPRMSAFIYEGKLPLTGITVNKLEDTDNYKNAFEIVGPLIERIVAVCQTREDQQTWVDTLRQQIRCVLHKSSSPKSPLPPPHVSGLNLPPASPYARLTEYFANLVKAGIITRPLLKRLLYRQFSKDYENVGIVGVKIRHNHKVECVIFPQPVGLAQWQKASLVNLSSDSSEEETLRVLERQDAIDMSDSSTGSTSSSPFSLMCYMPSSREVPNQGSGLLAPGKVTLEYTTSKSGESSFETQPGHQPFPSTVCQDLSHLSEEEFSCRAESRFSLPPSFDPSRAQPSLPIHTWHSTSTIILPRETLQRTHSSTLELAPSALPLAEITFDPVVTSDNNCSESTSEIYRTESHIPNCLFCGSEPTSASERASTRTDKHQEVASPSYVNELPNCVPVNETCACCAARPLSPRSSDSGLADITSPDITNSNLRPDEWLRLESSPGPATNQLSDCDLTSLGSYSVPSNTVHHLDSNEVLWKPQDHKSRLVYRSGMYAHWGLKMRIPATSLETANQHQLIVTRNSSNITRPSNLNVNNNINNINNNHIHAASVNNINNNYSSNPNVKSWTATNLRPAPPVRIAASLVRDDLRKSSRGPRKFNERSYEEDALVLRVIESYCTTAKTRSTISSALLDSPQEKGMGNFLGGQSPQADDKKVLDAVHALSQKVNDLQGQINTLMQQLDYETSARRSLQNVIHAHITSAQSSTHSTSLPLIID